MRIPSTLLVAALLVALGGCADQSPPLAPDPGDALQAKGGNKGGNGGGGDGSDSDGSSLVADVVTDAAHWDPATEGATLLNSLCPGNRVGSGAAVSFDDGCLIVDLDDTSLTNDVALQAKERKGLVQYYVLSGHEYVGSDAPMHESDRMVLDPPAGIDPVTGGTIHVHAVVQVWELSGHIRGSQVALKGTVAVGDVIYRQP